MAKRTLLLASGLVLLSAMVLIASLGEKHTALPIPGPQTLQPPASRAPCSMAWTNGAGQFYLNWYEAGIGTYTYFDPGTMCAPPPVYPFEITDFSFTFYSFHAGVVWPVSVDIVVYDMDPDGDICSGPGAELCRYPVVADQVSYQHPTIGTYTFPTPCCVNRPFFIGLEYTSGQVGLTPSIPMDNNTPSDTCVNWLYDTDGLYYEWYDLFDPTPPGYPLFWVNGETESPNCQGSWEPGDPHKMHYPQLPDSSGWDVMATYPLMLADDWRCSETGPIQDIHFWGSWLGDVEGSIDSFHIIIYSDIPADQSPTGYSMPGDYLWSRYIQDYGVLVTALPDNLQGWYDPVQHTYIPNDHRRFYQYDILLDSLDWFEQTKDTIYWLAVTAHVDGSVAALWGWKSTDWHFNDDATWGFVGEWDWQELYEPPSPSQPITNIFWVEMDPTGMVVGGGGDNPYGDGWYFYPSGWWNIWFYDHPFSYDRQKYITISFDVFKLTPEPSYVIIAVNYSTDWWSLEGNPPGELRRPPLPGDDEPASIVREILIEGPDLQGHFDFEWQVPFYNPEWVSIDIMGENFVIPEGFIVHECYAQDSVSLDLSFVMTGEATSCCDHDGIRGDVNYDFNGPNIVDLTYLVAYLFGSPPGPAPPCFEEGDVNGDGTINIVDLTHLVAFLFSGGAPPAPCP